jgi:hypothetical protein
MAIKPSYVEVLSEFHPEVQATAVGEGRVYDELVSISSEPIPPKEVLDQEMDSLLRTRCWRDIQAERDRRKSAGVKVGENWFHSDDTSRIQQLALVMFGANMPAGIMWKTMQGTFVPMTPALATQIFQATALHDQLIFAKAEEHRQAMLSSPDPLSYDFTNGWAESFAEDLTVSHPDEAI